MAQPIIIFGGSGFIGQAVCYEAIKRQIPVISISKHGKPRQTKPWMSHPLMTWKAIDIFSTDSWHIDIANSIGCINLIGILVENKRHGITYQKMIVNTNEQISSVADTYHKPYVFLSAKVGPPSYTAAKKQAEREAMTKKNTVTIIRSGLVTTKKAPIKYAQGIIIKAATHCPVTQSIAEKAYPVSINTLAPVIINSIHHKKSTLITDIR